MNLICVGVVNVVLTACQPADSVRVFRMRMNAVVVYFVDAKAIKASFSRFFKNYIRNENMKMN